MGVPLIIVARSDALSAKLIDINIDPVDQPYIIGVCPDGKHRTFPEEGARLIGGNQQLLKQWQA